MSRRRSVLAAAFNARPFGMPVPPNWFFLGAVGLRSHFPVVVTAEDVQRGKPDPEVYARAALGLGVPAASCLVFEDAPVGVQAARGAGMRVIGVTTAHAAGELMAAGAEETIPDFQGLCWRG